jgi:hypothetical protein
MVVYVGGGLCKHYIKLFLNFSVLCVDNYCIDEYLEKIKNSSIGDDTKSEQNSNDAQSAKIKAAKGDYIVRYAAGLFLFNNKKNQLKETLRKVNSIFSALGLKLLEPKENPLSQDDFIRSLPFCFMPVPEGPNKSPKAFWLLSTTGSNISASPPRLNLTTPQTLKMFTCRLLQMRPD